MKIGNAILRAIIVLFVLWHSFAIAVYSIPSEAAGPASSWIRSEFAPYARPYLYATSQWQQWNLFSPVPHHRVSHYVIERREGESWQELTTITEQSEPWWSHAYTFKFLSRVLEEGGDDRRPLRERYLLSFCDEYALSPGTVLRLRFRFFEVPQPQHPMPLEWWNTWDSTVQEYDGPTVICPANVL